MTRFLVTVKDNKVAEVSAIADDDEEPLGLEWAISEVRDSYRFSGKVDGIYTIEGKEEMEEFLGILGELVGGPSA